MRFGLLYRLPSALDQMEPIRYRENTNSSCKQISLALVLCGPNVQAAAVVCVLYFDIRGSPAHLH